jgi:multidrug efflux pump
MEQLIEISIRRSRIVLFTLFFILTAGYSAYLTIPKESDPNINIPVIYTSVHFEGISPEDSERLLVLPLEQQLRSIEGVKDVTSSAYDGGANVTLEFTAGFDVDKALSDVREAVDKAKADLPSEADEPQVNEVNLSLAPVLLVHLMGDVPERQLSQIAKKLERDIETLPQILRVDVSGLRDEAMEVLIEPTLVESYGLKARDIISAVRQSNQVVTAGNLDNGQGRFGIKLPSLIERPQDVLDLPVKVDGDAVVRIRDIAQVRATFKDRLSISRVNGKSSVSLQVVKRTGENIIDTITAVKTVVEAAKTQLPPTLNLVYSGDRSNDIRNMLADLENNLISAVLLIMVAVILIMGLRSGLIVGLAIPSSFLAGVLVLAAMGLTVNVVVLFSLILSVGMLVDGAIIITELADRKMAEGFDKKEAYIFAGKRMFWPVMSSTGTTIAAFLPLLFWPNVIGEFMKYMPITLMAVLGASIAISVIFIPVLGGIFGRAGGGDHQTLKALEQSHGADLLHLKGGTGIYTRLLARALRWPGMVLLAAFCLLGTIGYIYGQFGKGVEFFPDIEPEQLRVDVQARGNLSLQEKDAIVSRVERKLLAIDGFKIIYTGIGEARQSLQQSAPDSIGYFLIELASWNERPDAKTLSQIIRSQAAQIPGIKVEVQRQEAGPPNGKAIQLQLAGDNRAALLQAADRVAAKFATLQGLVDITDDRPLPGIEWRLVVDRAQAAKFGADVGLVGSYVRLVTNGLKLDSYRPEGASEEVDILIRFPEAYRALGQMQQLRIETTAGSVPIGNFVRRQAVAKVAEITRVDGQNVFTLKADLEAGILADSKVQEISQWLEETKPLPEGVTYRFKGEDEDQKDSEAFLKKAFLGALFLIAVILITQFNSFYSVLLILSAVILSTTGVLLGLLIMGQPFGIVMSGIGVIALAGVIVNNNIVLIDTYDVLRADYPGASAFEIILRTGAQRLRPVMLTAVTAVLGLVPMMLQMNIDFIHREISFGAPSTQWWVSLATAMVFGLSFGTILTLIVTPCALMVRANWQGWWRGKRRHPPQPPYNLSVNSAPAE